MSVLHIRVVSGALEGKSFDFSQPTVTLGRDPSSDLQLHTHDDREVSGRHAALVVAEDGWLVRDLGSLNGTFVNGRRVEGDTPLVSTDVIRLGPGGPQLRVEMDLSASRPATDAGVRPGGAVAATNGSRTAVLRAKFATDSRRLWLLVLVLFVGLWAVAGMAWFIGTADRRARQEETALLLARLDSVLQASEASTGALAAQVSGLADSLREARTEARRLQAELAKLPSNDEPAQREDLERRLLEATSRLAQHQLAASLDWPLIRGRLERAVARVFVEREDGRVESGTSFSVLADGTMVTAAHLVVGPDGTEGALRIGVQFAGTDQVLPADLVAVAEDEDLALIRVMSGNGLVASLNPRPDTIQAGQPVALLGFPLGGLPAAAGAVNVPLARPLASAGIIQGVTAERIEVAGYGERGASGSPVVDATGSVVGLLRGAVIRDEGQVLIVVPSTKILRLLAN